MKPFYSFTFSCFLAASATASAQLIPVSPVPGDDHVHLENMVVTATPLPRNQAELVSATTVLTGRALQMKRQPTLGDTLSEEVGMSAT
ncbi:MAG TPA: TonB-dependent receptor, partial [Opitutaceae bacterium]|nr:TonB-dependent receptor [Opitutaceae bacterium]